MQIVRESRNVEGKISLRGTAGEFRARLAFYHMDGNKYRNQTVDMTEKRN